MVLVVVVVVSLPAGKTAGNAAGARRRHVKPLVYHVVENVRVGSQVADLRADTTSTCDDARRSPTDCDDVPTRFSLLHHRPAAEAAGLFDVDETTGVLRTSGAVDREQICFRRESVCSVVLEVAVHYAAADAFDVAVVEVSSAYIRRCFVSCSICTLH